MTKINTAKYNSPLETFTSRFKDWFYDENIWLYVAEWDNVWMTEQDVVSNNDKSKKQILARQDDAMKQYAIHEVRQNISKDKDFGMRFVEHKMMQDQLIWNYDKSGNKVLPAIDYISDCISKKTGKQQLDIIVLLENFIEDKLWYSIREKDDHKSLKRKLADMIFFHYNYNTVNDVKEALIRHKWMSDEKYKAKEDREKQDTINIWNEYEWDIIVSVYDIRKALQEYDRKHILDNT